MEFSHCIIPLKFYTNEKIILKNNSEVDYLKTKVPEKKFNKFYSKISNEKLIKNVKTIENFKRSEKNKNNEIKIYKNKYFSQIKKKFQKCFLKANFKFFYYLSKIKESILNLIIHQENLEKKFSVYSVYAKNKNIIIRKKIEVNKHNEIIWVNKNNKKIFYDGKRTDINEIISSGVLRIGICSTNQEPFHKILDDGRMVGFDIVLANEICGVLGVRPQFIIVGEKWDEVVEALVRGNIDVMISNLSLTPERSIKILCSEPYAKIKQSLLINRRLITEAGNQNYFSVKDIVSKFGKSFVVESNTAYAQQVYHIFPKAKIVQEDSWKKIIQKICDREYIGTISDEIEIMRVFKKNPEYLFELMQVNIKNKYDYMVVGVKKSAKQLLHFINGYIISNGVECKIN